MKQTIYEEIQRMALLSRYDNSKTLSEQAKTYTPEQEIAQAIYHSIQGVDDEQALVAAIKRITSPTQIKAVDDALKKWDGDGIVATLNSELGDSDAGIIHQIEDWFEHIGAKITKSNSGDYDYNGNFKLDLTAPAAVTADDSKIVATSDAAWTKYPCVTGYKGAVKTKIADGSYGYWIDKVFYFNNGRTSSNGTMGNYTCNDPKFKTAAAGVAKTTQKPKTAVTIPTELKDEEGIKKFQDWLDTNAAGWASGYTDGIINKGQNGGGYGKFGPRTQKAWVTYKDKYLTPAAVTTTTPAATTTTTAPGPDDDVTQP